MKERSIAALVSTLVGLSSVDAYAQKRADSYENGQDISLAVGEAHTLSAKDVKNYSVGIADVIDVKLTSDASAFVINGRRPGSTTLLFIKNDGTQITLNVNVFSRSPAVVEKEISQLLTGLDVKPRRVGAQIVIDGTVSTQAELQRVQQVAQLYEHQVTSLVQLATGEAQAGPMPVAGAPRRFLIRIDFYFVQYDKNSSYGVGVSWPGSIGGLSGTYSYDFLGGSTTSAAATLANQPLPSLDIASRHGWAKVLKHSTVIASNDAEAAFSNGGEQNFSVNTGLTIGVQRIAFGTNLTVTPHYDPGTRELGLKLDTDISDLTASVSGALPGRTTSKLSTSVSLKLGQSIVLSGIRSTSLTHSVSGLPGLSEIPILGILFGSHSQTQTETEGAIFVVPSVVQSIPNNAAELVDIALKSFEDYSGNLDHVHAFDKNPGGGVGIPR